MSDWHCNECKFLNWGSRWECRECGVPKNGRDWICPGCKFHVFASKSVCGKCNTSKPENPELVMKPFTAKHEVREGDWLCEKCNVNIFSYKDSCYKCGGKKPENPTVLAYVKKDKVEVLSKAIMKEGDWLCGKCQGHNFASRKACFKCKEPKPIVV